MLKINIYPDDPSMKISSTYSKILNIIKSSKYYEPDPSKACLFVPLFDSLDRDPLSPDFSRSLKRFKPIDDGRNHLIFNLYSGSWPDYHELDFAGFNYSYGILVKASSSHSNYRIGFDVSFPLFSKNHPEITTADDLLLNRPQENSVILSPDDNDFRSPDQDMSGDGPHDQPSVAHSVQSDDSKKSALLVFKGKRYTYGIGSETRNSLYHIHNGNDVLMYTTCKHGKRWRESRDERCEKDNRNYEKVDYEELMSNSTFCLTPRGRRLGSFRFLESLKIGCVPVTLSNDWVKPFEEIIDWSKAVVDGDERSLFLLPDMLRNFRPKDIKRMRHNSIKIYDHYFSSVEKIVLTTISILEMRIKGSLSHQHFLDLDNDVRVVKKKRKC